MGIYTDMCSRKIVMTSPLTKYYKRGRGRELRGGVKKGEEGGRNIKERRKRGRERKGGNT